MTNTEINKEIESWQVMIFQSMDFLFVFSVAVLVIQALFEEGVLA